jgi:hypothetical protein
MSQPQLASGPDRLPWLADEPPPRPKRDANPALAAGVLVAIAAASFWIGTHGWLEPSPAPAPEPAVTAKLPEARVPQATPQPPEVKIAPQAEVTPVPTPEVRPAPLRQVRIEAPRTIKVAKSAAPTKTVVPEAEARATPASPPPAPAIARPKPLKAWPAWQSAGAKGRIVRIGAFGTRDQAKLGWHRMVQAYPAVAHLKATVVGDRNSRGRHFYRFQIGTTSQAHSEVLCQRMERIGFSCAVVGLPWRPRGVER